jgi:serine/threonine protein kinase
MVEHDDPGVVKLYFSFQDSRFLYFVMEYLPGGDMMNLLIKREILTEQETRFYISELIIAVQAIHRRGYIHRDLKPDNILIGEDGHIKLSDFGLCTSGAESHLSSFYQECVVPRLDKSVKEGGLNNSSIRAARPGLARRSSWNRIRRTMSYSTVGTSNYMAPEILLEQGYGPEIDWWSVGVILYECLIGYAPFSCEDTTETCIMILEYESTLNFPDDPRISDEARDLIQNRLLVDQKSRIGYEEIIAHPWFKGVDWKNIRSSTPPWVPELKNDIDSQFFDEFDDDNVDYFFGEDYDDTFDEFSSIPLKDWEDKHLPFVGWTFKRFEPKQRPSLNSVFGGDFLTNSESSTSEEKKPSPTDSKSKKNKKGIVLSSSKEKVNKKK